MYLVAVLNKGGQPEQAGAQELGDRVVIRSVSIDNGEIALATTTHGPEDPLCCPTLEVEQRYLVTDGQLVQYDSP